MFGYAFNISKCKGFRRCIEACINENNLDRNADTQYIRIFEIEDGVIDVLVDRFDEVPSPYTLVLFQQKAGAMSRGRPDQTAFGHRSDRFMFAAISGWDNPSQAEANIAWTRRLAAELEPYSSGGEYVNELGPDDPPAHIRASFGTNFDRLRELKTKYDPSNLFRHTQNIAPNG